VNRIVHAAPSLLVCRSRLLVRSAALMLASLLLPAGRAQDGASDGLFVSVQNPISSDVTNRVKEITNRAVQRFEAERAAAGQEARTFCIVLDFNPGTRTGEATPAGTGDFGPCYDLAKHLKGLQGVTTIAYVRGDVTRHTVLPVLACKEIVMAEESKIGDVLGDPPEPLSPSERSIYLELPRV